MWLIIITICALMLLWYKNNAFVEASVILVFIAMLTLFMFSFITKIEVNEYEETQYKIQGLENNITTKQETHGAFILGVGYINSETSEEMKYYFFKENEIGKKLESIEIKDSSCETYIRETNEIEPCLIYRYQESENKNGGFFKFLFGEGRTKTKIAQILVVPENTIKIEYNVEI